jgi:DnaJ like chaperone protein
MSIWGAILGGAAGFIALGGPLGALFGAAAGHAIGKITGRQEAEGETAPQIDGASPQATTKQVAFTIAVIALGAKMAKADGIVTRAEIDAFKQVFRIPDDEMKNVGRVFDRARRSALGFEAYAAQIAGMFKNQPAALEELLDGLFHIAKADGHVPGTEIEYLRKVAGIFGFSEHDFERIRAENLGPDKAEHHPDRLIAKGVPKEFIDVANEKLATINAAWDRISRERDIN